ncbi:MAG: hypothetical protein NTV34_20500 [Proteobacteria bacterium]|nr:hypothetical protein [Pseudomonadota bacterium]
MQTRLESDVDLRQSVSPLLVTPPQHLWEESRSDFSSSSVAILKKVFSDQGQLIFCEECGSERLHIGKDHTISLSHGDMSQSELSAIANDPRFQGAKAIAFLRETASGVELRIVRLDSAEIVIQHLADSRVNLDNAKARLGLTDEVERRKRGESLAYTFIDLGLYPNPMIHVSFFEQWGSRNQHLTGVVFSLLNPNFAIGGSYRYMLPQLRRCTISGTIFYPLQNAVANSDGGSLSSFAFSAGVQYAFSSTFGLFAEGSTGGSISAGLSFFNPIFFPFML